MASIQKRDTSYRITVSCGYDSAGRKIRYTTTWPIPPGMTPKKAEKEAQRQAVLFEEAVENGTFLDGGKLTFAEFTQRWLTDYAEKRLSSGTLKPYKTRLEKRILPAIGHIRLAKLQPHHLMEFYNNLAEGGIRLDTKFTPTPALISLLADTPTPDIVQLSGLSFKTAQRIKQGHATTQEVAVKLCSALGGDMKKLFFSDGEKKLSAKTIRHHHGIISSVLATAVKWNVIMSNPAERVDLGKLEKYRPSYYDDEQIKTMLTALEGEPLRYRAMVYTTIDTGMRTGEITGLKWSDLDLDKGIVTVCRQRQYVSGHGTLERNPKTESGHRVITLSETVTAILRQYKNWQAEELLVLGIARGIDQYVFLHEDGKPMHPHRPYKWFVEFLERHQLPKITYHQLRHTNASLLISAGLDIVTLSGRLGHADKNVTLGVYSHIIKSKEAQAANRMDVFYQNMVEKTENQPR